MNRRALVRDDRGAAAVILVLLTPVLFALAGLVLDGGRAIAARQRAADLAEQAARAGVDALDVNRLRATGTDAVDAAGATAAACRYVASAEPADTCTVTVRGDLVRVQVGTRTPTVLLGLIGVNSFRSAGVARAVPVRGVTTGEGP